MDVKSKRRRITDRTAHAAPRVLLVGPFDPHCGEFTFLAPPLGVWRLQGFLASHGILVEVFDPNLRPERTEVEFAELVHETAWDVIGVSTTGMTLQFDLGLAHAARAARTDAVIIAGGMEATFDPALMFSTGPFDMVVCGEGDQPMLELCRRLNLGGSLEGIPGTAVLRKDGEVQVFDGRAMDTAQLTEAIYAIPYDQMPYERYWDRLESSYGVSKLPYKARREASLAEIRSVRLITLNYCPMGCTFCSSTNFLHHAQGGIANIARLCADDCIVMMEKIVKAHPTVRTIIFQDDIFVFTNDKRVLPLCEGIIAAKARGSLPPGLQFISTNRIDAMTPARLSAMRDAGFRVLGFGIENFSRTVLAEFNKKNIYNHIEPVLQEALRLGITPFLDLILTSPRSRLADLAETVRQAHRWILAGCEIGIYPYVIPFSGAAMSKDPQLKPQTIHQKRQVPGTAIFWQQATKILPLDGATRDAILRIEALFERARESHAQPHLPSRTRSLLWIQQAIPVLRELGETMPDESSVVLQVSGSQTAPASASCAAL